MRNNFILHLYIDWAWIEKTVYIPNDKASSNRFIKKHT